MEWLSAGASAVQAVRIVYDTVKHHTPTSQLHQGQHHLYKGIGKIHRHMEKLPPRALSALMHKHDHLVEEEREVRMEREKPLGAIRAWGPAHEFKDHAENFTQEVSRSTHDLRATEINSYLDQSRSWEKSTGSRESEPHHDTASSHRHERTHPSHSSSKTASSHHATPRISPPQALRHKAPRSPVPPSSFRPYREDTHTIPSSHAQSGSRAHIASTAHHVNRSRSSETLVNRDDLEHVPRRPRRQYTHGPGQRDGYGTRAHPHSQSTISVSSQKPYSEKTRHPHTMDIASRTYTNAANHRRGTTTSQSSGEIGRSYGDIAQSSVPDGRSTYPLSANSGSMNVYVLPQRNGSSVTINIPFLSINGGPGQER